MAQPASPLDVRPGVLPLWDIDAALARLPAEQRAKVAWAKAPARAALSRLENEALTDELLEQVAKAFAKPLMAVTSALWEVLATREAWQTELEATFRDDTALMSRFLGGREDAQDTLNWCLEFVRRLVELTSMVNIPLLGNHSQDELSRATERPQFVVLMKAEVALLAALQIARISGDPERVAELIDLAFVALCEVQDSMRQDGLWLNPFVAESPDERAERTLRYARQARNVLSEEDVETLDAARLRSLR